MNKIFVIILLLLFTFPIKSDTQICPKPKANYLNLIYLPREYSIDQNKCPLVIYLGGGSQAGHDLNQLKTYGIPHYIEEGHGYSFITVSPQCLEGKYWTM